MLPRRSGGAVGAEAATLAFMVGATDDAFARAAPLLKHMGKTPIHCGPVGAGLAVKLANNLSLALQMLGTAEAFALGVSQGVDPKVLKAVFDTSSARCWSCDAYPRPSGTKPCLICEGAATGMPTPQSYRRRRRESAGTTPCPASWTACRRRETTPAASPRL